jgi:hypothetical protein
MSVEEQVINFEEQWKKMDAVHARQADFTGFTVDEYAARYGLLRDQASHRLRKMARRGELLTSIVIRNKARTRVYRFPD